MAFNGKLIELLTGSSYVNFPLKYIKAESYKVTPDQRMESSADRSASGVLIRHTLGHTATKIDIETPPITNKEANAIHALLTGAYTDSQQRKLGLRYYNPATDSYATGEFYIPDIDYDILKIDTSTNTIHYNPVRIAFIEY